MTERSDKLRERLTSDLNELLANSALTDDERIVKLCVRGHAASLIACVQMLNESFGDGDAKSPTPRTDAAVVQGRSIILNIAEYEWVGAALARQLEREVLELELALGHPPATPSATKYGFEKAHAVCILKCRDALIANDLHEAYHWLYTLDSKQVPHDPFKPWADLEALAGADYERPGTQPEAARKKNPSHGTRGGPEGEGP